MRELLEAAIRELTDAGIEAPRRNAEWMLGDVLCRSRAGLYADLAESVAAEDAVRFERMLARRLKDEPLQYILGYTEFYGLRLRVTPDVLIPRPETEEVVEVALEAIREVRAPRVLDAGTGSGCIALGIKSARPDAQVFACDISAAALDVARRNASVYELGVEFFEQDMLDPGFSDRAPLDLDLLVSNPPYVTEEEAASLPADISAYEPHLALFAREDPVVFYRQLAAHGGMIMRRNGLIVLECHAHHASKVGLLLQEAGYEDVEVRRDLSGRDRIVLGRWPQPGFAPSIP